LRYVGFFEKELPKLTKGEKKKNTRERTDRKSTGRRQGGEILVYQPDYGLGRAMSNQKNEQAAGRQGRGLQTYFPRGQGKIGEKSLGVETSGKTRLNLNICERGRVELPSPEMRRRRKRARGEGNEGSKKGRLWELSTYSSLGTQAYPKRRIQRWTNSYLLKVSHV